MYSATCAFQETHFGQVARRKHKGKRGSQMSKAKIDALTAHLIENANKLQFGSASLVLKVHSNKVVQIIFESTECVKEREEVRE
jgi:hypothetical protein